MTPDQAWIVRMTWTALAPRADEVVADFYARLFELEPEARRMFAHVDMAAQRRKFGDMLGALVHLLDDPADVVAETIPAARRHTAYGVGDRHLDAGREALLDALAAALGAQFTIEARQAWAELYDLAAAVMRRASVRVAAARI